MSGESIRCPQCGGSLDVGRSAVSAKCAYCGSTIKLKVDAAGQVIPFLEQMQQDSSIVAKRAAMEYLQEQLQEEEQYKADLESDMDLDRRDVNRRMARWVFGLAVLGCVVAIAVGAENSWFLYSVLFAGGGWSVYRVTAGSRANRQIKDQYLPLISEADEKIKSHQARIQQLQEEVAHLARTV